jgi:GT2 family glycosyltransferase
MPETPGDDVDISVVIACYSEERLASIESALTSLRKQSLEPRQVILAVDNNQSLANRLADQFDWVTVVLNDGGRGASATRNRGVQVVDTPYTAFLDDDETADPDWLLELTRPFTDIRVVGTGGKYEPVWATGKPEWFPDEFAWVVGGAYEGLPTVTSAVRNVWSGNMAVRTDAFRSVGGFRAEFGKQDAAAEPEDTDLCIRIAAASGGHWVYVPSAVINHDVPAGRASLRFFVSRCFAEGRGKAAMSRKLANASAIDTERDYARNTARTAARRLVSLRWVHGLAMLLGLASAGAGYMTTGHVTVRFGHRENTASTETTGLKPARILDYDIATPLAEFVDGLPDLTAYRQLWLIVRASGGPVGLIETSTAAEGLTERIADRLSKIDYQTSSTDAPTVPPPSLTVAICTRERPDELARVLDSLELQVHRDFTVLVVDNAPTSDATSNVVERYRDRFARLDYVAETTPGLSHARNRALATIDTELVAWIDDDETADANWLTEILNAFTMHPDAAAVSGSVVPAELETWPQWWFEQYGGHSKGRGFTGAVFSRGDTGDQSPLYPLPAFGAGANMAFRVAALADIGGFDNGLGAGTATFGGEDTLVFSQLLLSRYTVIYRPTAMTRHFHRRTPEALERQMFGYGVGLTSFYVALLRWNVRLIVPLLGLVPRALGDVFGLRSSAVTGQLPNDFPPHLVRLKQRGMLVGPVAYLRARRIARRTGGGR